MNADSKEERMKTRSGRVWKKNKEKNETLTAIGNKNEKQPLTEALLSSSICQCHF